jgi:mono/diheme cytochrome c family protein
MPDLLAGEADREGKVEALVHLLASTGALKQGRPDRRTIASGRDLYHKVGCVACHGTRAPDGSQDRVLPTSVPLGDLKAKYTLASLGAFLANPHQVRPSGRMPRLLNAKEANDVANFLLQGVKVNLAGGKGATRYAYYEGNWDRLPDFAKLRPVGRGVAPGFDIAVARRNSNYALKFEGVFKVEREATYTFTLTSDDGSRLYVDGKQVVDNDGTHPAQAKSGRVRLAKGFHDVTVTFFQGGGEAALDVQVGAPGLGTHNLGDLVAVSREALTKRPAPKEKDEDAVDVQPALVAKGKALFGSLGCAACHQLEVERKPLASTAKAPPLAKLREEAGCLAPKPAKGLPAYALAEGQRKAIGAALKAKPPASTPAVVIARTLAAFNCYACHARDKVGGPEPALDKLFQTTQPEMGDEGRLPPPLDGVGAKLNPEYLRHLLDVGGHDRPYMHTRMPGFGNANVGHLAAAFANVDRLPAVPAVKFGQPLGRVKSQARKLVGGEAFGCIKCHTFAGHKAEGVQGIDMTLMTRRLRRDWFHAYVLDPQRIRPGTRMPSAFIDGKSLMTDVMDGKGDLQIEAMWVYLKDGGRARLPLGLRRHSIPLVPTTSAILYRNFIEGAGTRAIGVGYPEKANLAFDANEVRLALIWHGGFIDAARHWTDRGAGFEGPLGDDVVRLHGGAPFAVLAKPEEAWPAQAPKALGFKFKGYRLTRDDRPTFLYSLRELTFEDFPNAVAGKGEPSLRRTITVAGATPPENLYHRAAVGNKVETLPGGWYRVDGAWKVKVQGGTPTVRKSGGKVELLVLVPFKGGKARLVLDYVW